MLLRVSAAATVAGNALVLVAFAARPALRGVRSNLYIFSLGECWNAVQDGSVQDGE